MKVRRAKPIQRAWWPYANRPWTLEERAKVLEQAPPHVRVAIVLIMNTGLDPSGALKLTRRQIDGDTIRGMREKTGEEVAIPIGLTLQAALDKAPTHDAVTILARVIPLKLQG